MPTIFVSKLEKKGTIHPNCINNDKLYSLIVELNLSDNEISAILNLHESKLKMLSVIESMPGHVASILLNSDDKDYVYSGSVWETRELFDLMLSIIQEHHSELLTSYNTLRKNFFDWALIEFSNGQLYSIENIEMLSFEMIDQLNNNESINISTPFNLI